MSALNLCPRICFFFLFLLSLCPYLVLAQEGELALFLDDECKTPSQLTPSASLALSTCFVPVDVYGIAVKTFPACENGTASLIMYHDTACSRSDSDQTGSYTGYSSGANCFYYWVLNSIPGVMFTCEEPAKNPQATSATTITASAIAGVATPVSSSTTATTNTAVATMATNSESTAASTATSTSNTNASPSASSTDSSSGLSMSDKIAIGVGLGVGIPSIVIALLAWCYPR